MELVDTIVKFLCINLIHTYVDIHTYVSLLVNLVAFTNFVQLNCFVCFILRQHIYLVTISVSKKMLLNETN